MKKAIAHLRGNVVAYLALFVALGGTGYAAISIPRNSVGAAQLRNGAVTQKKLDKATIGATIRAWARISVSGSVIASSSPAQTIGWGAPLPLIQFKQSWPANCFAMASMQGGPSQNFGFAWAVTTLAPNRVQLVSGTAAGTPEPLPMEVIVLCPT